MPDERDVAIAEIVRDAARDTRPWAPGAGKVYVSDVYDTIVQQGRDGGVTLPEFKRELVRLHRLGLVTLARADLVAAMDSSKVARSEIDAHGAEFHFVHNPGAPMAFYIDHGDAILVPEHDTFEGALDQAATDIMRGGDNSVEIVTGSEIGGFTTLGRVEHKDTINDAKLSLAMREEEADFAIVLDPRHIDLVPPNIREIVGYGINVEYGPGRGRAGHRDRSRMIVVMDESMRHNPAGLTAKGERMYKHVLESVKLGAHAREKGAKRIASATVMSAARRGVPGLVRKNPDDGKWSSRRSDDFKESGNYDVMNERGEIVTQIFRDPENREWYQTERGSQKHYTERWLGSTRDEAVQRLASRAGYSSNPDGTEREAAFEKYKEFHRYDPRDIGDFPASFRIPAQMRCVGDAMWTTYRSAKVDPATLKKPRHPVNYIHEHDAGVEVYVPVDDPELTDGRVVTVPREFTDVGALVKLGESLGYCIGVGDDEIEAEAVAPLPELYCSTSGKCLYVVQDKSEVIAMIWGGALGVFGRGIDG